MGNQALITTHVQIDRRASVTYLISIHRTLKRHSPYFFCTRFGRSSGDSGES